MPSNYDFQATISAIKNNYLHGSKQGYVPLAEYKNISKAQQQGVYRLRNERYGSSRPSSGTVTSKEYSNLKIQVSLLSKKVDDSLTIEEPSGDKDGDKNNKSKLVGCKSNLALGRQWWWQPDISWI